VAVILSEAKDLPLRRRFAILEATSYPGAKSLKPRIPFAMAPALTPFRAINASAPGCEMLETACKRVSQSFEFEVEAWADASSEE
jgi:hypothetical protein